MSEIANNNYSPAITITSPDGNELREMDVLKQTGIGAIAKCDEGHIHIYGDSAVMVCRTCADSSKSRRVREIAEYITGIPFMLTSGVDFIAYINYDLELLLVCTPKLDVDLPDKYKKFTYVAMGGYMRMSLYQIICKIAYAVNAIYSKPASCWTQNLPPTFIPFVMP